MMCIRISVSGEGDVIHVHMCSGTIWPHLEKTLLSPVQTTKV